MNLVCRKIDLTAFLLLLLFSTRLLAQAPDTLWTRTYGGMAADVGESVQETVDSGYIIAGSTTSYGAGENDVYIIKTDVNGDTVWTRTYGGTHGDAGYSVQQTTDGGYVIVGFTYSYGAGESDVYLIKTDDNGDTLWTKTYGGQYGDFGCSVQQTSDQGYIVTGIYSVGTGSNVYLIRTDENGDSIWTKTYGEMYSNVGWSVQQTFDSGFIIAGRKSISANDWDVWLLKTDANGDISWSKTYGEGERDEGRSVQVTDDGGFIIGGYTCSFSPPDEDVYLIRTDSLGDTLWTRTFHADSSDRGASVQQTSDNGYIIAGYTNSYGAGWMDVYLIKANEYGDTLWTKTIGGYNGDYGHSVQITSDGGYIIAGHTLSFGGFWCDVYLIRIAPDTFGIEEPKVVPINNSDFKTTIFSGPLLLPEGKQCKIFDITGRTVAPDRIKPGIYFVEIDGVISHKVIKIK